MKKKLLTIILAVVIIAVALPFGMLTVNAEKSGSLYYTVTDGEATITSCENVSGNLVIPDTLGGYPVTTIGQVAFFGCDGITSVEIPSSVTTVKWNAFENCTGLTSITIPDSVTTLDYSIFEGCTALTTVVIGDGVTTTGKDLFWKCTSLKNVTLGKKMTQISDEMFYGCTKLESISIPDSVTRIGKYAFYNCTKLKNVEIGSGVTAIDNGAFCRCTSLETITIPNGVTDINFEAFEKCTSLKTVVLPNTLERVGWDAFSEAPINEIYFEGAQFQMENIEMDSGNESLKKAAKVYSIKSFPDVNYSAWYGPAVFYAVENGLMKGYANGKFGTADGIQRQDFVVILSRLSGDDIDSYAGKTSFKDVPTSAYYAAALAWAKDKKVSSGYANGKFGVGDKVTREQIVTFLYNYAKLKGYNTTVTSSQKTKVEAQYSDFKSVSGYAKEAVYWALSKGVISGKNINGTKLIAPKANAQRCEVAAMFYNIDQKSIFQ